MHHLCELIGLLVIYHHASVSEVIFFSIYLSTCPDLPEFHEIETNSCCIPVGRLVRKGAEAPSVDTESETTNPTLHQHWR